MLFSNPDARPLYAAAPQDAALPVDSHWQAVAGPMRNRVEPLEGERAVDVAVVGAGFTGLWAALTLAREHGREVCVLDAGPPGSGASGRNGGFCSYGATKLSYTALAGRYGEAEARRFAAAQREAIDTVAAFLDAEGISAGRHSDGELMLAHRPSRIAELEADAREFARYGDLSCTLLDKADLARRGADGPRFFAGLHVPRCFALNPLIYVRALADRCIDSGVRVHAPARVVEWRSEAGGHRLTTAAGAVRAKQVVFAMNGYGGETLSAWLTGRTLPVMSAILVTRPLSREEQERQGWTCDSMAFDTPNLLHYFRKLPDGRFMFGGRGGISSSPDGIAATMRRLRLRFEAMFPEWRGVETERQWYGYVCMARDLVPYCGPVPGAPGAFTSLCYHGNGVAMTSFAGRALAGLVAGAPAESVPAAMRGPLRRFPFPALRLAYLRAAYGWYGLKDRF